MQFTTQRLAKLEEFEHTDDGAIHYTRALIRNAEGAILGLFDTRFDHYQLPGGKVDKGENQEEALVREVEEEIGCSVDTVEYIGAKKLLFGLGLFVSNTYKVTIQGEPIINEPEKFSHIGRGKIRRTDANRFGIAVDFGTYVYENEQELLEGGMYEIVTNALDVEKKLGGGDFPMVLPKQDFIYGRMYHLYFVSDKQQYVWYDALHNDATHIRVYSDSGASIMKGMSKVFVK